MVRRQYCLEAQKQQKGAIIGDHLPGDGLQRNKAAHQQRRGRHHRKAGQVDRQALALGHRKQHGAFQQRNPRKLIDHKHKQCQRRPRLDAAKEHGRGRRANSHGCCGCEEIDRLSFFGKKPLVAGIESLRAHQADLAGHKPDAGIKRKAGELPGNQQREHKRTKPRKPPDQKIQQAPVVIHSGFAQRCVHKLPPWLRIIYIILAAQADLSRLQRA